MIKICVYVWEHRSIIIITFGSFEIVEKYFCYCYIVQQEETEIFSK